MSEENDILHKTPSRSLSLIDECTDLRKQEAAVKNYKHEIPPQLAQALRLPDTYEAKIAKIGNFWTF